jgi:hypothetical protein
MYMLFAYHRYYPVGGWSDFKGLFESKEAIMDFLSKNKYDYFTVIERSSLEEIYLDIKPTMQ